MEITQTSVSEERIAALEKKCREMDAMVKGLLEELLDLKTISMKMTRDDKEYNSQDPASSPPSSAASPSEGSTVIRPKGSRQPDAPAEPAMVRIMQDDGTMKMEPRYGNRDRIDSAVGYGRNKKGTAATGKQSPLIYAAEEEKPGPAKE